MAQFTRNPTIVDVTVAATEGAAKAIPFLDYAGGILEVPSAAASGTMTFYVSDSEDGTFLPLERYNETSAISVTITAGRAKELPPEVFSAHWIKFVMSAVNSTVNWKLQAKS